jgi:putative tricarboxylic transport membrane protein
MVDGIMELTGSDFVGLFLNSMSLWWVIIPAVIVGVIMGAIPGFAAHNTIIMLLPLFIVQAIWVAASQPFW